MRGGRILLLGLLLAPLSLQAQAAGSPAEPREQVAALIREALRSPDRAESWIGLAQGLEKLESGGADGLQAAVHIADSLARAPAPLPSAAADGTAAVDAVGPVEGTVPRPEGLQPAGVPWLGKVLGSRAFGAATRATQRDWLILPGLLGLALGGVLLVRRTRRGAAVVRRTGVGGRTPPRVEKGMTTAGLRKISQDSRGFALALWESGLPASEVARQTGLAQDGLAFLLTLQGRPEGSGGGSLKGRRG